MIEEDFLPRKFLDLFIDEEKGEILADIVFEYEDMWKYVNKTWPIRETEILILDGSIIAALEIDEDMTLQEWEEVVKEEKFTQWIGFGDLIILSERSISQLIEIKQDMENRKRKNTIVNVEII